MQHILFVRTFVESSEAVEGLPAGAGTVDTGPRDGQEQRCYPRHRPRAGGAHRASK